MLPNMAPTKITAEEEKERYTLNALLVKNRSISTEPRSPYSKQNYGYGNNGDGYGYG